MPPIFFEFKVQVYKKRTVTFCIHNKPIISSTHTSRIYLVFKRLNVYLKLFLLLTKITDRIGLIKVSKILGVIKV